MHQAALLGQAIEQSRAFGWDVPQQVQHSWYGIVVVSSLLIFVYILIRLSVTLSVYISIQQYINICLSPYETFCNSLWVYLYSAVY